MSDRAVETYRMMYRLFPVILKRTWLFAILAIAAEGAVHLYPRLFVVQILAIALLNGALARAAIMMLDGHRARSGFITAMTLSLIGSTITRIAAPQHPPIMALLVLLIAVWVIWAQVKTMPFPFAIGFTNLSTRDALTLTWRTFSAVRWWSLVGFILTILGPVVIIEFALQRATTGTALATPAYVFGFALEDLGSVYLYPGLAYYAKEWLSDCANAERPATVRA